MKKILFVLTVFATGFGACGDSTMNDTEREDTATNAVINAEGEETNAYNLPGSDTGAIHENTSEPGVLDMDAREDSTGSR